MKSIRVPFFRRGEHYVVFFAGVLVGMIFLIILRFNSFDFISPPAGIDYRIVYVVRELENQNYTNHHRDGLEPEDELRRGHGGATALDGHRPTAAPTGRDVHERRNDYVSRKLYDNVRILCWIMTAPKNHESKARHAKATWAKRCNKYVFMSTREDKSLPSIKLNVSEVYSALWGKTKRAYEWCYKHHLNDFDWFLKADDDTYVVVENLRYLLSNHSPDEPVYYGKRFKQFTKQGFMSGGAGYVLSREALRRFVEIGLEKPNVVAGCEARNDTGAEDTEIGKCLDALGVKAGDTLDEQKRNKFFPLNLERHLTQKHDPKFWYWNYTMDDEKPGFDCCSDFAISFHYMTPNQMYLYDFLIYHLRPYGISYEYDMPKRIAQLVHQKTPGAPTMPVGSNATIAVVVAPPKAAPASDYPANNADAA